MLGDFFVAQSFGDVVEEDHLKARRRPQRLLVGHVRRYSTGVYQERVRTLTTLRTASGHRVRGFGRKGLGVACLLVLAILHSACMATTGTARSSYIVALMANNTVAIISQDGGILTILEIGGEVRMHPAVSHRLVAGSKLGEVQALVPDGANGDVVVTLDVVGSRTLRTCPPLEGSLRSLDRGPMSGLLYVVGNLGESVVIYVVDPLTCEVTARHQFTPPNQFDWLVYRAVTSSDESAVLISYHGQRTTGIDRFDLGTGRVCEVRSRPNLGCLPGHGNVERWGLSFVATSGEDGLYILNNEGRRVASHDVGLPGNHVMEVAIDPVENQAYLVGSCFYARGLSRVRLSDGLISMLSPPHAVGIERTQESLCGERLALGESGLLAIAQPRLVPSLGPGALTIFDPVVAKRRQVALPNEPIDVIVVSGTR